MAIEKDFPPPPGSGSERRGVEVKIGTAEDGKDQLMAATERRKTSSSMNTFILTFMIFSTKAAMLKRAVYPAKIVKIESELARVMRTRLNFSKSRRRRSRTC